MGDRQFSHTWPPVRGELEERVWRVRLWIRVVAALAAIGCLLLAWTLVTRPPTLQSGAGDRGSLVAICLSLAVLLPWASWVPAVRIGPGDRIRLRGMVGRRDLPATDIRAARMTSTGLNFDFVGAAPFTSIVFQDTRFIGSPRYAELFEALTGVPVDPEVPFLVPALDESGEERAGAILDDLADVIRDAVEAGAIIERGEDHGAVVMTVRPRWGHGAAMSLAVGVGGLLVDVGVSGRWGWADPGTDLPTLRGLVRNTVLGRGRVVERGRVLSTEVDVGDRVLSSDSRSPRGPGTGATTPFDPYPRVFPRRRA